MPATSEVQIAPLRPERFAEILACEVYRRFDEVVREAGVFFAGRSIWNVNSTARGGGVAEMLASLLSYARGAGVDARWIVITGNPSFFAITKRIHNHLHGAPGDGGPLGDVERRIYERTLQGVADDLQHRVRPGDLVLLHDPQTAGLGAAMRALGATVVWRCHVGLDTPNAFARRAWSFLRGFVEKAHAYVFSRPSFVWEGLAADRVAVIPPSIDAFSPKNQQLPRDGVDAILATTSILDVRPEAPPAFVRADGTPGAVRRRTEMFGAAAPTHDVRLIVQVSRWDRLKDPLGVLRGFAQHVAPRSDAHLFLAGPAVTAVADDPEGLQVLEEVVDAWRTTPAHVRDRIHLACIPMDDAEENAAIVNALQRRADTIVQKSLAEGFGLTVAEGMWKSRPVVATRTGGIQDQIDHGISGMLLPDPHDGAGFGAMLVDLLDDAPRARRIGLAAQERVRNGFLGPRHLTQYFELARRLAER